MLMVEGDLGAKKGERFMGSDLTCRNQDFLREKSEMSPLPYQRLTGLCNLQVVSMTLTFLSIKNVIL